MIRPNIRIPLWAAVALPAAAYVVRSLMRGGDFRPDLPSDALAYFLLALVVVAVGIARSRTNLAHQVEESLAEEMDSEDGESGKHG